MGFKKWREHGFEPDTMLVIFTLVNTITYFDRGVLGALLDNIEKDYNLSNTLGGLLASAYMVGYVIASPVFAHYAPMFNPLRMMAGGLLVWAFAVMASGLTVEYYSLLVARSLTGAGEASFLCLAPPFIDRYAPPDKRSSWLAIFYLGLPLGYAFGATTAGQVAEHTGGSFGWRAVFVMEGVVMLPFIIACWLAKPDRYSFAKTSEKPTFQSNTRIDEPLLDPSSEIVVDGEEEETALEEMEDECMRLKAELSQLGHNKLYLCIILGYAAQTFVTGGFAVLGVKYLERGLLYSEGFASTMFGGITAATGISGTMFGGWVLDKLRERFPTDIERSLEVALAYILFMSVLSLPTAVAAFALSSIHRGFTFAFLGVAEFIIFACISPINAAIMWSVPFVLNPIAIAMSVVCTHMLGDAASPTIIGVVQDDVTRNWTQTMILASMWLLWSILFFGAAYILARHRVRKKLHSKQASDYLFGDSEQDESYFPNDEEYDGVVYEPVTITNTTYHSTDTAHTINT